MIECMIIDLTLDLLKEKATKKKATREHLGIWMYFGIRKWKAKTDGTKFAACTATRPKPSVPCGHARK